MNLTRFSCNEKAITNLFSLQDLVKERLSNFEMFLKQVKRDIPELIDNIIDNIISQYGETEDYEFQLESEHELLKEYPELLHKSKNIILSLLTYSKYEDKPSNHKIFISFSDVIRSDVIFRYYQINSLLTVMSRDRVIKFYKKFIDHLTQQRIDPKNYIDNIDDRLKEWRKKAVEVW